jgi:hypothetical protein
VRTTGILAADDRNLSSSLSLSSAFLTILASDGSSFLFSTGLTGGGGTSSTL